MTRTTIHCSDSSKSSKTVAQNVKENVARALRYLTYVLIGLVVCACAQTKLGREARQPASTCLACPTCPQSDCSRTLNIDERKTSEAAYAVYYTADGNFLFGEDFTGANVQCRIVNTTIFPLITLPCPVNKPWQCGTAPNTFCSAVKYPGCH